MQTQPPLKKDDLIEGTIQHLAFGGEGILRHSTQVVFIPFTAPGDKILCKITETKKNFARGIMEKLIHAGSGRIAPTCSHYGKCGGCQLQHLSYESQLEYKQEAVIDSLQRIAHIHLETTPSIVPATQIWNYRRHVTLTIKKTHAGYQAGYTAADHFSFLPIAACPIFIDPLNPIFSSLQKALSQLSQDGSDEGKIYILKKNDGTYIWHLRFEELPTNSHTIFMQTCSHCPVIGGVLLSSQKGDMIIKEPTTILSVEGLDYEITPGAFLQNNSEQSLNIYKEICIRSGTSDNPVILDLYSGIGISALLLARLGAKVTGIEYNGIAVAAAKKTARKYGIPATFIQGDVGKVLKKQFSFFKPDIIIANPPREGLDGEVVNWLKESCAKRILYISCMPSTLARDLKKLCDNKYHLHSCHLFDMFPQTAHVEVLVELKLQPNLRP